MNFNRILLILIKISYLCLLLLKKMDKNCLKQKIIFEFIQWFFIFLLLYFIIIILLYILEEIYKMGCETSELQKASVLLRNESSSTEGETTLEFQKFIDKQRGKVFELYHFSKVMSRNATIVRKVLQRNSRIERICKIVPINKRQTLFASYQIVEILKNLNHPNIVQIIQYFQQNNFLYIILENIPGKTISQAYYDEELKSLDVIIDIIKQILLALKFCHEKGYAHKSIDPEHIMIFKMEKTNSILIKIIGFGSSMRLGAKTITNRFITQNALFVAPENYNTKMVDKQDIWGCGILFLSLLTGQRKFDDFINKKDAIIENMIKKQNLSQHYQTIIMDFLNNMLKDDPLQRFTAQQAVNHSIFKPIQRKNILLTRNNPQIMQNLLQYRVQNNLTYLFQIYASLNILSLKEKSQHVLEFYQLDKNKDGKIGFDELVEGLQNTFNVTRQDAIASVNKIFESTNKSEKTLQFHEYVAATAIVSKEFNKKCLVKLFDQIDQNKDGQISSQQLSKSVQGLKIGNFLKVYKNNKITFEQFLKLMMTLFQNEKIRIQGG